MPDLISKHRVERFDNLCQEKRLDGLTDRGDDARSRSDATSAIGANR